MRAPAALLLLLGGCAGSHTTPTRPTVPLDVVLIPPEGVALTEATVRIDAFVVDTCDGTLVLPAGAELDGLDPSPAPAFVLPGGWCGLQAILPGDAPDLELRGTVDGEPLDRALELGGLIVLGPFFVDERPLLLRVPLDSLDGGEPVLAELWADVDEDGFIGEADERLR